MCHGYSPETLAFPHIPHCMIYETWSIVSTVVDAASLYASL